MKWQEQINTKQQNMCEVKIELQIIQGNNKITQKMRIINKYIPYNEHRITTIYESKKMPFITCSTNNNWNCRVTLNILSSKRNPAVFHELQPIFQPKIGLSPKLMLINDLNLDFILCCYVRVPKKYKRQEKKNEH